MSENATQERPLPAIWRTPDELWEIIESILQEQDPPKSTGRPRIDQREALDAIMFRMRSGWQWNQLPKELPDDSSVHRTFQRWLEFGVLDLIRERLIEECEDLGGLEEEGRQLPGVDQGGLYPAVVPTPASSIPFEIVGKRVARGAKP